MFANAPEGNAPSTLLSDGTLTADMRTRAQVPIIRLRCRLPTLSRVRPFAQGRQERVEARLELLGSVAVATRNGHVVPRVPTTSVARQSLHLVALEQRHEGVVAASHSTSIATRAVVQLLADALDLVRAAEHSERGVPIGGRVLDGVQMRKAHVGAESPQRRGLAQASQQGGRWQRLAALWPVALVRRHKLVKRIGILAIIPPRAVRDEVLALGALRAEGEDGLHVAKRSRVVAGQRRKVAKGLEGAHREDPQAEGRPRGEEEDSLPDEQL
eukprot:scaffold15188_cov65-Phaeocystis_antarctica.AAC.3